MSCWVIRAGHHGHFIETLMFATSSCTSSSSPGIQTFSLCSPYLLSSGASLNACKETEAESSLILMVRRLVYEKPMNVFLRTEHGNRTNNLASEVGAQWSGVNSTIDDCHAGSEG